MPLPDTSDRPAGRVAHAAAYEPDLEAHGLRVDENGDVVAVTPCADRTAAAILSDPAAQIDARIWEGRFDHGRLVGHRVTERMGRDQLASRYVRLRESLGLRENGDWFSLGAWQPSQQSPLTQNFTPMIPGPATRQQYWSDYWASSSKCFEASTHSGVAKRACRALVQFPLGRGVRWDISDDRARQAWEAFWTGNRMRRRLRSVFYDLAVFGEQFLRWFPARPGDPRGLIIRQLDPATIYEIVTDQEDLETVFYYHQQFQTRTELYSPPAVNIAPQGPTVPGVTRYIIRQIPAQEIDHWKINDVSGEARGRSDLFAALGDLKRMRDLLTSKVIQADIGNRVLAVLTAKGTQTDISRLLAQVFPGGQPPAPGSVIALNDAATLQPFQYTSGREVRSDFTYDELVDAVCAATGIARPYLGLSPAVGSGSTQAAALTTVEPSVQTFEERQDIADEMLHQMFDRVMAAAGINGETECEFVFPEIASEDSQIRLGLLEQAESDGWISKRRAASTAAAEMDFTDYDFDEEMREIISEFADADETDATGGQTGASKPARGQKIRRPVLRASARQAPKLDPTRAQSADDEPPGVLVSDTGQDTTTNAAAGERNPASQQGRANIRRQARESDVRRRSDDPAFIADANKLERATAQNLRRLLSDIDASADK